MLATGQNVYYPFEGFQVVVEDGVKQLYRRAGSVHKISPPEPMVVKADGLAAGKGVFVCSTTEEALAAIERIMVREEFGRTAGRQIIIEKKLEGEEVSLLALVAGRAIVPLPPTQDHKRAVRRRQGAEHRRHGRVLPRAGRQPRGAGDRRPRRVRADGPPHAAARHAVPGRPLRRDHGHAAGAARAGVQLPLRRPGVPAAADAPEERPARPDRGVARRPARRGGAEAGVGPAAGGVRRHGGGRLSGAVREGPRSSAAWARSRRCRT